MVIAISAVMETLWFHIVKGESGFEIILLSDLYQISWDVKIVWQREVLIF